jgi:hypothetical protein
MGSGTASITVFNWLPLMGRTPIPLHRALTWGDSSGLATDLGRRPGHPVIQDDFPRSLRRIGCNDNLSIASVHEFATLESAGTLRPSPVALETRDLDGHERPFAARKEGCTMMDGRDKRLLATSKERDADAHSRTVLAVSLGPETLDLLPRHVLEPHSYVARVTYDDLDSMSFAGPKAPALVLSPLLTPVFDAIDLARYLSQRGYRGRYLALVDRLPSANLIRREVEAQSPDLNFDVVVLDGSSPLHSL